MEPLLIYKSKFEDIYFDSERREALQVWFETTSEITDALIMSEQTKMAELYEEYKPLYHLADARNFLYPVSPEIQEWISVNIAARIKVAGVRKSAMVLPKEFIPSISVEQLEEEIAKDNSTRNKEVTEESAYDVGVFGSLEEARKWFYGK